jgi:hypothetical protein
MEQKNISELYASEKQNKQSQTAIFHDTTSGVTKFESDLSHVVGF